ncbi:hypothetical protein FN846DRAFT_1001472 [Sphaerosporella brunnea]|uniref:SET domain-containing protein n=1 Tax=Sphaerosporella brunnea TaxID=1250544 RepID=A0A5J5EGT0_9PEZI|nr:hypothetical protein FN846DRAFT_1001472 [Sphaerosporella brunnea]
MPGPKTWDTPSKNTPKRRPPKRAPPKEAEFLRSKGIRTSPPGLRTTTATAKPEVNIGDEGVSLIITDLFFQKDPQLEAESEPITAQFLNGLSKLTRQVKTLQSLTSTVISRRHQSQKESVNDGLLGAFWLKTVLDKKYTWIAHFFHSEQVAEKEPKQLHAELVFRALGKLPSINLDFLTVYSLVNTWERYLDIVNATDWNLLTILLHSPCFLQQVRDFSDERWKELLTALVTRRMSVKTVGYECFPEWRKTFESALPGHESLLVKDGFPTEWREFARYKHRLTSDDKFEPIANKYEYLSICSAAARCAKFKGPETWPEFLPVRDGWKCSVCTKRYCQCLWEFSQPIRVELFAVSNPGFGKLSTGCRTLQAREVPVGTIIGEYTGVFVDEDVGLRSGDRYGMNVNGTTLGPPLVPRRAKFPGYAITAYNSGSFLRFINHSCIPNCALEYRVWRGRRLTFVTTIAKLAPFEEITYDYGADYWSTKEKGGRPGCLCPAKIHNTEEGFDVYKATWAKQNKIAINGVEARPGRIFFD